ncbi:T9SS type A sorting domain-containing protein [Ginsengibacter hankyongi]|uniref:T9SS type A sorting domain-containing protein n=1 Tax=Ginsengibacter hankyongi TaxID=2607284 RepID=A0A5J5IBL2_9BACT|nr:T9SS type A sorting domain-containing protein [Ginsengibacter hankyongi]KAA9035852.1 T9SS type A sorting domain-containing protein [Ginsengibacter hankyongi]
MKKLYPHLIFAIFLFSTQKIKSQCTCSDGSIPDSISYNQNFDSIVTTNTVISFPQFDPTIGVLTCFRLRDTVSTVVNYNLQNNLPDTTVYNFETFRRSQFTGPGSFFTSVTSAPKDFGPYTLSPKDSAGDNVDIGPDTVFNKRTDEKYGSSNSAFYGTGTVDFNYLNTSTFTILTGSDNAIFTLKAYTRLKVQLVYYWCPLVVLETHLTGFNLSLRNNNVLVQWTVNDPRTTDKYEIEISTDGKLFKNLGEGVSNLSGNLASYSFIFTPDENFTGNLFFRVKQTDYAGKFLYSQIHSASINKNNNAAYSLYPNPSISGINIHFIKSTGGLFEVELINSLGQTTFFKKYSLNQSGSINIEWAHKPAAGIYFLNVRDLKNNTEQVQKLKIL